MWLSNNRKTNNNQLKQTTMKKYFMYAVAVAATMSLTSCMNEEDMFNQEKDDMGTISVNITADNTLATRGTQNVASVGSWYAWVKKGNDDKYGTEETKKKIVPDDQADVALANKPMPFGSDYTVTVSSHPNMAAALVGFGVPYYEGSQSSVKVTAGDQTPVDISCGRAKNAKLVLDDSGFTGATLNSVIVTASDSRTVTFSSIDNPSTISTPAYFKPEIVSYVVNYTFGGSQKTYPTEQNTATINLVEGTLNKLIFTTNGDGTISIGTISYNTLFDAGVSKTVTISAEDGQVLSVEEGTTTAETDPEP